MPLVIMSSVLGGPKVTGDGMCWMDLVLAVPVFRAAAESQTILLT